jgi:copper chaperone
MTQRNTILHVDGMSCGSCVRHVSAALSAVPGVSKVDVTLRTGTVAVQHSETTALPALLEAIEDAGYSPSGAAAQGSG